MYLPFMCWVVDMVAFSHTANDTNLLVRPESRVFARNMVEGELMLTINKLKFAHAAFKKPRAPSWWKTCTQTRRLSAL